MMTFLQDLFIGMGIMVGVFLCISVFAFLVFLLFASITTRIDP